MNLNQALTKLVKPQLKLMQISSRNVTSLLFINKHRNKLNENLKTNSLNTQMSISSSAITRQNDDSKTSSGNQNRLMLMDIPRNKFPSPLKLIIPYYPFQFVRMILLDKSFNFPNFMQGAEQVMSIFLMENFVENFKVFL
jgi:hypothetical protein